MKVKLFVHCLYLQFPSSSFSSDYDFELTIHALYIWLWNCVYVTCSYKTNQLFIHNVSTILKNQKQSGTSEPHYQVGSLLTQRGLSLCLE